MRKIFNILLIMGCMALLAACGDDEMANPYANENAIKVVNSDVIFGATGGNGTITVNAPGGITRVESSSDWVTCSANGSTVNVTVAENVEPEGRSSRLTIHSGNESTYVVVQQQGLIFNINNGFDFVTNASAEAYDLDVAFTGNGTCRVEPSTVDWATFSLENNVLHVVLALNTNGTARSTEAVVTNGEISSKIKIQQDGLFFIVNDAEIYEGGDNSSTKDLAIRVPDGIKYEVQPSSVDWARFSIVNGALRVALSANNTGNPRRTEATITYAGSLTCTVPILQYDFEKDVLGSYTFYYGTNGASSVDVELVKEDGKYGLQMEYGTIPLKLSKETLIGSTMTFTNLDFVGSWTTSKVTTENAIVLLMYTNGSSVYRTKTEGAVSLVGEPAVDESGVVSWNLTGTAPSGYSFYALRVANTSDGTYTGITSTNISAWNNPVRLEKK